MALNFPNSGLTVGQQYTGDNGVVYIYDGVKWVGNAPGNAAGTNSIINGDKVIQIDGDGNLVIPIGATIKDANGDSVLTGGTTVDQNIWVQTFVSSTPETDLPALTTSVEYDADGNIIALFVVADPTDDSSYTAVGKYTSTGTRIWTVRLAADFYTDGWGLAVGGGAIYITGNMGTGSSYRKSTLSKLSLTDGTVVWSKMYDFGVESNTGVVDVGADGNPVVVGYAKDPDGNNDYITTTKINATTGAVIWTKELNGQADEEAYGMAVGSDGSTVVVGYISQLGLGSNNAVATVVTVPSSNPNWVTQYGGGTEPVYGINSNNVIFDITMTDGVPTINITSDVVGNRTVGETIVTLYGEYFGGVTGVDDMVINVASVAATGGQDDRMLVVKYDSDGDIVWQKAVLFDTGFDCGGADADIDSNGNVYVTGQYRRDLNPGTASAMSIVKFNSSGVKQWSRRVTGDCDTFGNSIVIGPDDKLYVSGMTYNNNLDKFIWVVAKYGFDGTVEWQRLVENTASWSFNGSFFFGQGGGSNIAVKEGYVALGGGFGTLPNNEQPHATLVQIASTGDTFATGAWDFTTANFSGNLYSDASDITVVDAQLTDLDNILDIDVGTITPDFDSSNFVIGTIYRANADNHELVSGNYSFRLETDGTISLPELTVANSQGYTLTTDTLALGSRTNNVVITQQPYNSVNTGSYNIEIRGQRGYGTWSTSGNGGYGSGIEIHGGRGGETSDNLATGAEGGEGGYINIRGGNGQAGKKGGYLELRAGDAQFSVGSSNNVYGGNATLAAGNANENIEANKGYGGSVFINAGQGNKVGQHGDVVINTDNSTWAFTQDGRLGMPNGYALTGAQNAYINAGSAPTVCYTSLDGFIGGIKATIKVSVIQANNIDGDHDEDVQMCEMIISTKRRFIDNGGTWVKTAVASVYGVTHTSTLPLATFTVAYVENYVSEPGAQPRDVVQILAEPTAAVTGTNMWVMVTATELTND